MGGIFLVITLLFFVTFSGLISSIKNRVKQDLSQVTNYKYDAQKELKKLQEIIKKDGINKAYQDFAKNFPYISPKERHSSLSLLHWLGGEIYRQEGLKGVVICDDAYDWACIHGFINTAIVDRGIDIVMELEKVCIEKYGKFSLGCQHGIGHGLGEYFGSGKLVLQLDECSKLSWKGDLEGCQAGVFMEYNFPSHLEEERSAKVKIRHFDNQSPYFPCNELPKKYRRSCYFELTRWLLKEKNNDFKFMGNYCSKLTDEKESEICFIGTGDSAIMANKYDSEMTFNNCMDMPDNYAKILCTAGSAYGILSNPQTRKEYPKICEKLGNTDKITCLEKSDILGIGIKKLIEGLNNTLPLK